MDDIYLTIPMIYDPVIVAGLGALYIYAMVKLAISLAKFISSIIPFL